MDSALMSDLSCSSNTLEMLSHWEPSARSQAAFSSGLDATTRSVRVMGAGVWHSDDVQKYFDDQRRIVEEARRRFGPLRIFFDVRNWVVENPQSAIQFQPMNAEIYQPGDRIVALVHSFASKQHARTALSVGNREVFVSVKAAETWLQACTAAGSSI